jgi:hypothetical protein
MEDPKQMEKQQGWEAEYLNAAYERLARLTKRDLKRVAHAYNLPSGGRSHHQLCWEIASMEAIQEMRERKDDSA